MLNRIRLIVLATVLCCYISSATAGEKVKDRLENAPTTHPRLFLPSGEEAALREKIAANPLLNESAEHVVAVADMMLEVPLLERKQVGRRLLNISRECLRRTLYLGLAYRLTENPAYTEAAEANMLAVAAFSDWNPDHFLDVAEMTAALAVGYDWCYDALTPDARLVIRDAIIEKGLRASMPPGWWNNVDHNWNQVCHGGLVMGALVVYEDEPELSAQVIERAINKVPKAMAIYEPDGNYPEGPTYWSYGTTFNLLLIDALESVLGTDFGLRDSAEGFMGSSEYIVHAAGPSLDFFNYSDSGLHTTVSPEVYWFAARDDDPSLLWRESQLLPVFLASEHKGEGRHQRFFPMLLLWAELPEDVPSPESLSWKGDGKAPIAVHRSNWQSPDASFVGIKAGSPSMNHAHMDIGSFVMEADGERWAVDLGAQGYHSLESKGINLWDKKERWTIFRLNNFSHNTLVVDGQLQDYAGHSPIVAHSADGPMPHSIVDLSPTYVNQLANAKRGAGLHQNGYVVIQDELTSLNRETEVRWGMVTRAGVTVDSARQATLRQGGKQLTLHVLSPANAVLELYEIETPPNDYDAPNPDAKMIGFTLTLPANAESTLTVVLQPGKPQPALPDIAGLAEW